MSSQISSKAKETSCLQPQSFLPPSPLHSDSTSDSSTSTLLFFQGCDPPTSNLSRCFQFETRMPSTMHGIFDPHSGHSFSGACPQAARHNTDDAVCTNRRTDPRGSQIGPPVLDLSSLSISVEPRYSPLCPCR